MTENEISNIKGFIKEHNKLYKRWPQLQIDEKSIFVGDECETTERVFKLIMKHQCEWNEYFNFLVFTKPLVQKLSMKLFNFGKMRADDCLFYQEISLC
jgi:hypothetical protein